MAEGVIDKNSYFIKLSNIIYFLNALGVFFFMPLLIAVMIAYLKINEVKGTWLESHFNWQIRTFWFYILWLLLGVILTAFVVGIFILMFNHIWLIYRLVKGWLALTEKKPLA
ncbi:MAG: hypothetical protein HRT87_03585 [Legionellales bacterium]|nr:hypothetical protein [Legionellales bacterium]